MEQVSKKLVFLLALSSFLFLTACGSGGGYTSVSYGVYGGYGYPYGYGYRDVDVDIDRPDREERTERRDNVRTNAASRSGASAGMGRPARMSRGGGGRRR